MHKQCSRKHAPPASDNYFLFSWHWPLPFVLVVWITSSVLWKSSPSFHHCECGPTVRSERDYYDVLMWSCKYLALPIAFILPFCYKARALIIRGFSLPLYSSLSYYLVLGTYAQTAVKMSISTGRRREMVWPDVGSWWWVELTTSLYQTSAFWSVLWWSYWGNENKYLFTWDRDPTTDQRKDTVEVHLGDSMSSVGVAYRNISKGSLGDLKCCKNSCITKFYPNMGDRSWKLETWGTLNSL